MDRIVAAGIFIIFVISVIAFYFTITKKDVGRPEKKPDPFDMNAWILRRNPGIKK